MRNSKMGLKALGVAILASLSMMAVFAAGAQGQGTAGKFLIGGSDANLKASVTQALDGLYLTLLIAGRGIIIKCKAFTISNGFINNNGDASGISTHKECQIYSHPADVLLAACTVHSTGQANGIITASGLALPRLHNANRYMLFEPQVAGGSFTTIELLGAACAAEGVYPVKGSVVAEVTAATNNTTKPLLTSSEAIQKLVEDKLLFGAFEAFMGGSATVELTGAHAGLNLGVH